MTGTQIITLEQEQLPGVDDIKLNVNYVYTRTPARLNAAPEDCYPEEEECEISLPREWQAKVMNAYIVAGFEAVKKIECDIIPGMEFDNMPRKWVEEDSP